MHCAGHVLQLPQPIQVSALSLHLTDCVCYYTGDAVTIAANSDALLMRKVDYFVAFCTSAANANHIRPVHGGSEVTEFKAGRHFGGMST